MAASLERFLAAHYRSFGEFVDVPVTGTTIDPDTSTSPPSCQGEAARKDCQARVHAWMAKTVIRSFRGIEPPVLLLLLAGWLPMVAYRRFRW